MLDKIVTLIFIGLSIGSLMYALTWKRFFNVFGLGVAGSLMGGVIAELVNNLVDLGMHPLLVAVIFSVIFISLEFVSEAVAGKAYFLSIQQVGKTSEYLKNYIFKSGIT